MLFGCYPPGVTDKMIDDYFGNEATCEYCRYYFNGICEKKENEATEEELAEMEEKHDFSPIEVDEDDCCDDYKYNEDIEYMEEF